MGVGRRLVEQFVNEGLPTAATVDQQVFQLLQALQVNLELRVSPVGELADVPAAETVVGPVDALLPAGGRYHFVNEAQQPACLRRQFVHGSAQHFAGQPVRHGDVVQRDFDVFDGLLLMHGRLDGPLVLMQAGQWRE